MVSQSKLTLPNNLTTYDFINLLVNDSDVYKAEFSIIKIAEFFLSGDTKMEDNILLLLLPRSLVPHSALQLPRPQGGVKIIIYT